MDANNSHNVPFIDLRAQHAPIKDEIFRRWNQIYDETSFISGKWVEQFENRFADLIGVRYCVAVSNGTAALEIALRSLKISHLDEVIIPTNSFIATAESVSNVGAIPVFVDCDEYSNLDVRQLSDALSPRTVGIIGVHLYGNPADFDEIESFAQRHGLWTLEDAAQGHLATYKGRNVGTLGAAAAFSFYPGKNLGATGEGGAITTNSPEIADLARMLRAHGETERYKSRIVGGNGRMTELIASALDVKLDHISEWTKKRQHNSTYYRNKLRNLNSLSLDAVQTDRLSCNHLFVAYGHQRDLIRKNLLERGVNTGLHYPVPIHLQDAYVYLGYQAGQFPVAEQKAESLFSLPMYAELTEKQIDYVCAALADVIGSI
jgi:dTDP-4-amino-4,6-dideoxygalactose transaminase